MIYTSIMQSYISPLAKLYYQFVASLGLSPPSSARDLDHLRPEVSAAGDEPRLIFVTSSCCARVAALASESRRSGAVAPRLSPSLGP